MKTITKLKLLTAPAALLVLAPVHATTDTTPKTPEPVQEGSMLKGVGKSVLGVLAPEALIIEEMGEKVMDETMEETKESMGKEMEKTKESMGEEMEKTKESMAETMEETMEETKKSMAETVEKTKKSMTETVEGTEESMKETMEKTKESMGKMMEERRGLRPPENTPEPESMGSDPIDETAQPEIDTTMEETIEGMTGTDEPETAKPEEGKKPWWKIW
jgi:hypothetical protein